MATKKPKADTPENADDTRQQIRDSAEANT
jgi:hypothetical protein